MPEYVTASEAAEVFDVSEVSIRRLCACGVLRCKRLGPHGRTIRIPLSAIETPPTQPA